MKQDTEDKLPEWMKIIDEFKNRIKKVKNNCGKNLTQSLQCMLAAGESLKTNPLESRMKIYFHILKN